jgi:hypothetical protein
MTSIRFSGLHIFELRTVHQGGIDGRKREDFKYEIGQLADRVGGRYLQKRDLRYPWDGENDTLTTCYIHTGPNEAELVNDGSMPRLKGFYNAKDEAVDQYVKDMGLPRNATYEMGIPIEDIPHHLRPFYPQQ